MLHGEKSTLQIWIINISERQSWQFCEYFSRTIQLRTLNQKNYDEHFRCSTGVPLKWKPMEVFLISLNFVKWKLISLCLDLTLYFSGTLNKILYHFIYQKPNSKMEYIMFFTNILFIQENLYSYLGKQLFTWLKHF